LTGIKVGVTRPAGVGNERSVGHGSIAMFVSAWAVSCWKKMSRVDFARDIWTGSGSASNELGVLLWLRQTAGRASNTCLDHRLFPVPMSLVLWVSQ